MARSQHTREVFVVYPGALFTWWEVVRENDDGDPFCFDAREPAVAYARALAATGPGGVVRLENWFGETEATWDVAARSASPVP
jgi:hypothetical protein